MVGPVLWILTRKSSSWALFSPDERAVTLMRKRPAGGRLTPRWSYSSRWPQAGPLSLSICLYKLYVTERLAQGCSTLLLLPESPREWGYQCLFHMQMTATANPSKKAVEFPKRSRSLVALAKDCAAASWFHNQSDLYQQHNCRLLESIIVPYDASTCLEEL